MALQYIVTNDSITVLLEGIPKVIPNSHKNFKEIEKAIIENKDETLISGLLDTGKELREFIGENETVVIKAGEIIYKNEVINSALSKRILSMKEKGFDITPFTKFMENLFENPSYRAVTELYGFLEACNLPITEDGHFLAYKKVKDDYTDCYTGTFDNSIGAIVSMPRYKVNEDKNQTCSTGLHVASYSYMKQYSGDRIVICKINPRDAVSVPTDYNNAKMRVCRYEVVNEVQMDGVEIEEYVISDKKAYKSKSLGTLLEEYLGTYDYDRIMALDDYLIQNNIFELEVIQDVYEYREYSELEEIIRENIDEGTLDKKDLKKFLREQLSK